MKRRLVVQFVPWSDPPVQRKDEEKADAPLGAWLRKKITEKRIGTLDELRARLKASSDTFYGWFRPHVAAVPSQKYVLALEAALHLNREEKAELREDVLRRQQEASDANRDGLPEKKKTTRPPPQDEQDFYPSRREAIELSRGVVDEAVLVSIAGRRLKSDADPGRAYWLAEIADAQRERNALGEAIEGLRPNMPAVGERKGKKR